MSRLSYRDNNFIKDFPQLADGLMVIPLPVEEQCRGVLSEPLPNLQLLTGLLHTHETFWPFCYYFPPIKSSFPHEDHPNDLGSELSALPVLEVTFGPCQALKTCSHKHTFHLSTSHDPNLTVLSVVSSFLPPSPPLAFFLFFLQKDKIKATLKHFSSPPSLCRCK